MAQIRIENAPEELSVLVEGETQFVSPPRRVLIEASHAAGVAPAGFMFRARANGWGVKRPTEELRYRWSFEDPHAPAYSKLNRAPAIWGTDQLTMFGDRAAHVWHPPRAAFADGQGGYLADRAFEVVCEVTDGTEVLTATAQITVQNPDFVFAGDRTVLVALDSDFSQRPDDVFGPGYIFATALPTVVDGRRILLKRGESYAIPSDSRMNIGSWGAGDHNQVGAWGSGARPILSHGGDPDGGTALLCNKASAEQQVSLWGIDVRSTYSAITETTTDGIKPSRGLSFGGGALGQMTLSDMAFLGTDKGIVNSAKSNTVVVADTLVEDFRDFGLFLSSTYNFAAIGCRVERPVGARGGSVGGLGDRGVVNDHGPIRNSEPIPGGMTLLDMVELYSCSSWGGGSVPSHQPGIRWNTKGNRGAGLRLSRAVIEGGNSCLNLTGNKNTAEKVDAIVDKAVLISNANGGGGMIGIDHVGVTIRNVLGIMPRLAVAGAWERSPSTEHAKAGDSGSNYGPLAGERVRLYNCTFLDWTATDKAVFFDNHAATGSSVVVEVANNIRHAPNFAAPQDEAGRLDFLRLFAPLYPGKVWVNRFKGTSHPSADTPDQPVLDTASASLDTFDQDGEIVSSVSLPVPVDVIATEPGPVALDDIFGDLRGPMPSQGAVEPGAALP